MHMQVWNFLVAVCAIILDQAVAGMVDPFLSGDNANGAHKIRQFRV